MKYTATTSSCKYNFMIIKKSLVLSFMLMPFTILSQECSEINKKRVSRLQGDIITLASDEMEGREPGTNGEIKARDYIISRMQEIGLTPKGTDGFIQAFTYFEKANQNEGAIKAHNVIGFIDNSAEKTVVISAHYDHLGYGGAGSKYKGPSQIHNGADDNASGTAALLELAHLIKNNKIKEDSQVIGLLEDISKDLFNYDLEFRIQELESKFSKDMSESTFNELKELKNERKIN